MQITGDYFGGTGNSGSGTGDFLGYIRNHHRMRFSVPVGPRGNEMALIDELLQHYRERCAQMLDDAKHWRTHGWRLHENNKDITEQWLSEQERRAADLARIIADYEKRNV